MRYVNVGKRCAVCPAPAKSKGYCRSHYDRQRRHGDPLYVAPPRPIKTEKWCPRCGETKPREEYYQRPDGAGGLRALCRSCFAEARRREHLARKFGLTPEAYDALLEEQEGRCAICRGEVALDVDHCHASGVVRGLLCRRCNLLLGNVGDDPELLRTAADYLEGRRYALLG